jgi:hypothetical protein
MPKITVTKTVYWDAGGKEMTGKVKQIYSDYVVIKAADCEYIVKKSALSLKPIKTARKDS